MAFLFIRPERSGIWDWGSPPSFLFIISWGFQMISKQFLLSSKPNENDYVFVDIPTPKQIKQILSEFKLEIFNYKLKHCGRWYRRDVHCNQCIDENSLSPLLESTKEQRYCGVKYCDNIDCIIKRFSELLENMKSIKEFKGYDTLWHIAIGFDSLPINEFKTNFKKIKKQQEYVINTYMRKLKKEGVKLEGIKVLDFSFVTDGMIYPHYHLAVIPLRQNIRRMSMITMKRIEKEMKPKKWKGKITPFHVQIFKHAQKQSILSYLAIRGIGLYKYDTTTNPDYEVDLTPKSLRETIESGKYFMLKDFMNESEYLGTMFNKRTYTTFGSVSYGSTIRDNVVYECKIHGFISGKNQVRIFYDLLSEDLPPNLSKNEMHPKIEYVYLGDYMKGGEL